MRHRYKPLNYSKLLKNKKRRRQYKVHREQMAKYDIQNLADLIRSMNLDSLKVSQHVKNKNEKSFTLQLFKEVLYSNLADMENKIIEYNEIPISTKCGRVYDKRVLIRDSKDFDGNNLCIVLSLTQNQIVTAYWIDKNDNHDGLNWARYNPTYYISAC